MSIRILLITSIVCLHWLPTIGSADTLEIKEWLVPWENSRPRDPFVDQGGRVWFVGQSGHYVANLSPETSQFNRYDLDPGAGPHNLIVDDEMQVWYAGNLVSHIGLLNPATGQIKRFDMPHRKAKDPHTLVFDSAGDIWFTVQQGNFVGKLTVASGDVQLIEVPTRKARPYGIVVNAQDEPWAVEFGTNKLLRIDADTMTLEEFELPDNRSRPRRLVISSDNSIWYCDYALGKLGRFEPDGKTFTEWDMPGGDESRPYGMAIDRNDRIWLVETGLTPNRFVGFDVNSGNWLTPTDIPSGGGSVRHMYYFEPAGEIWFGTDTNYIGRAKVH